MIKFLEEQETAAQPPEPRGERTPKQAAQRMLEEESGETMLDETTPEETDADDEEQVEWDGSEAELVADESTEYGDHHTGIKLKYSLKSKEIFYALMKTQYTSTRIALSIIAVALSAVVVVGFLIRINTTGETGMAWLVLLCGILMIVISVVPTAEMKHHSKKMADGNEIKMKIYPDHIQMGHEDKQWEIPLDGTSERTIFRNLMILYIGGKNMVILPIRCVEPNVLPEVQAMIFAGTEPKP